MSKIDKGIKYVIAITILIVTIYSLGVYKEISLMGYLFIMAMDFMVIYVDLFLVNIHKRKVVIIDTIIILLAISLLLKEGSYIYYSFILIALFQILRSCSKKLSYGYMFFMGILLSCIQWFIKTDLVEKWTNVFISLTIMVVTSTIMILIHYIIVQNDKLQQNQRILLQEKLKTEYTYEQLKKAYDRLEEYTVLKERDRIAREMHDTVGHSLTLALVELERYNMENIKEDNKRDFQIIIERVRRSLYDIRTTVHKIKDTSRWLEEIDKYIDSVNSEGILSISYTRDNLKDIDNNVFKCIYRIIQEAMTNGIKHGGATAFIIAIKEIDNNIVVRIINNGRGTIAYKKGFGLRSMEERLVEFKGHLEIETEEGFTITAYIPKG